MITGLLWFVGIIIFIALGILLIIGIIKTIVRVAFSLVGVAALIWLVLFLMNTRIF